MTRLIDADKLCEEFKERQRAALRWKEKAILDGDEERSIRADATLAFLSEVKLTIDNAPTIESEITNDDLQESMTESYHLGYELAETKFKRPQGEWKDITPNHYFTCGGEPLVICPFCGDQESKHVQGIENNIWNFCPICGADMREADNE